MNEQALLDKLNEIENAITNHVITEIKSNRDLITGIQQEVSLIRQSLTAHRSGFNVLNDRVHALVEQIQCFENNQ